MLERFGPRRLLAGGPAADRCRNFLRRELPDADRYPRIGTDVLQGRERFRNAFFIFSPQVRSFRELFANAQYGLIMASTWSWTPARRSGIFHIAVYHG
jgi:hypothetical protein